MAKNKSSANESKLRKMVRQMIQEELKQLHSSPYEAPPFSSYNYSQFPDEENFSKEQEEWSQTPPWATFGAPVPAKQSRHERQSRKSSEQQNPWSEPYHPEFDEFDAPPFFRRHAKK
ncbi:hypothetical protein [Thermoflavimicrobium dichotomicum]|uniref:Uncharacterized protein n=1 Tax=Thermoflavimicrobium dichotomicum TaxID=46223 RepID=A0A1I3NJ03_9BACL|nr:hypothetical protein [Thermoflavimicrobium dichotomicum]SFJ09149.1 hypothetical protein SAMN05421852_104160 [Thermoflavimicrobium dichotomicum]